MAIKLITNREVPAAGASRPGFWARRRAAREQAVQASRLVDAWNTVAYGLGLGVNAAGQSDLIPQVTSVILDESPRLLVKLRPWQSIEDIRRYQVAIARGLGVHAVRLVDRHGRFVRVELLHDDPLADSVHTDPLTRPYVDPVSVPVLLGRTDAGVLLWTTLLEQVHIVVQGQTRSGKSRWCYSLLAQAATAPDLIIAGTDITSLLLRPFAGTRHASWQAIGPEVRTHLELLARVVAEMERRLRLMPADRDVLPLSADAPMMLVVVEEYSGLLESARALDALAGSKSKIAEQIKSLVGRLLAESAKVGMRVLLITQRAEASVLGGFHRGQAPLRLTFRVEDVESIRMLHPTCPQETAAAHLTSPVGRALVSGVALPLAALRAPEVASYAHYVDAVRLACPPTTAGPARP